MKYYHKIKNYFGASLFATILFSSAAIAHPPDDLADWEREARIEASEKERRAVRDAETKAEDNGTIAETDKRDEKSKAQIGNGTTKAVQSDVTSDPVTGEDANNEDTNKTKSKKKGRIASWWARLRGHD